MRFGDKLKKNFAKNLQSLRTRNDLTQAKLVDVLNDKYKNFDIDLRRTSIVSYEAEGAMPKMDSLYCIADYFGKTIDQMISSSMDRPVLAHPWMSQAVASAPRVAVEMEESSRLTKAGETDRSAPCTNDAEINTILSSCVDGITYRQFYVEFLKDFLQQLRETAPTTEYREELDTIFYRTFLACQISKSKYLHDLAGNLLDKQEFSVFMAFENRNTTVDLVAKALKMSEEEVVSIFNSAQAKMAAVI